MTHHPRHSRTPNTATQGLTGPAEGGTNLPAPSAEISGDVGFWLAIQGRELAYRNAVNRYREAQSMPGYTPSSTPIAEIRTKPKKRDPMEWMDISPAAFFVICIPIALVGIAALIWSN